MATQLASEQPMMDQAKMGAFVGKAFSDASGSFATVLAAIGDRLGLFKDLAAHGPATSGELAARTGINERYAREWLSGLASAGYLEYDPTSHRFTLPPEHIPVLAQEGGPIFLGGAYQMTLGYLSVLDHVIAAFRAGGGVSQSTYGTEVWEGMERFGASMYDNLLVPVWIPAIPGLRDKLERGAQVADVGCGSGRALITLAQAFPNSHYVGYDSFETQVARATANAAAAGVADRVRFEQRDVAQGLPEQYDVIATFDVVHDAVEPLRLLRAIRQGLKPDGVYLCLEFNCSDKLEENAGPLGTIIYGISVMYCMTTSLAAGGEGLGTAGLPEAKLWTLSHEAGFGSLRRVPIDNPMSALYEIRP